MNTACHFTIRLVGCVAQPELLGTESLLTTRLLIALFGALCFGAVGLADDVVRLRHQSPLGLRRPVRLALEAASGTLVLALDVYKRQPLRGALNSTAMSITMQTT